MRKEPDVLMIQPPLPYLVKSGSFAPEFSFQNPCFHPAMSIVGMIGSVSSE
jgi:hypothetical protein